MGTDLHHQDLFVVILTSLLQLALSIFIRPQNSQLSPSCLLTALFFSIDLYSSLDPQVHTSRLPCCGTVSQWERSGEEHLDVSRRKSFCLALLSREPYPDPTCRCVGVPLSTFLLSCARALRGQRPKIQSRKRVFESTFSKCASKKYDIIAREG